MYSQSHREYESIEHEHVIALWDEYTVHFFVLFFLFQFFKLSWRLRQLIVVVVNKWSLHTRPVLRTEYSEWLACCWCVSYIRWMCEAITMCVTHTAAEGYVAIERQSFTNIELVSFCLKDIPMWANGAYYTCWDVNKSIAWKHISPTNGQCIRTAKASSIFSFNFNRNYYDVGKCGNRFFFFLIRCATHQTYHMHPVLIIGHLPSTNMFYRIW